MSTALRSLRLLDALFKYACGVFGRAPCIHGPLHRLATKPCEKCGLEGPQVAQNGLFYFNILKLERDAPINPPAVFRNRSRNWELLLGIHA